MSVSHRVKWRSDEHGKVRGVEFPTRHECRDCASNGFLPPVRCPRGITVSRIFISHSSIDNAPAIAVRDWLVGEGWDDLFLDLDPELGIAAGERLERALNEAARHCEAVLFLIYQWLWADKPLPASIAARSIPVGTTVGITIIDAAPIAATIAMTAPMVATMVASMAAPMVAVPPATMAEGWSCYER